MILVFSKNDENEISVLRRVGDDTKEFSYVELIKSLIEIKTLEPPAIDGDFSESEKESITNMVEHINNEVAEFHSEEED